MTDDWLIQSGADYLHVVASKDEVQCCNPDSTSRILNSLLSTRERVMRFRDSVDFGIDGYDDDQRELFEIPEVRGFMERLDREFPYWFYFLTKRRQHSSLRLIALCLCRYTCVESGLVRIDQGDLANFLFEHFDAANRLLDEFALDERENERISEEIVRVFADAHDGSDAVQLSETDVDSPDKEGWTPLHHAANDGDAATAQELIVNGADVKAADDSGDTPLDLAAASGHPEVVSILLDHGADPDTKKRGNWTPIFEAVLFGYAEVVAILVARGAEVDSRDLHGRTLLWLAASQRHRDVAEILITNGADVNARDHFGQTPLHTTFMGGYKEVIELLIANGADVHAKDDEGFAPLQIVEVQRALSDKEGLTP